MLSEGNNESLEAWAQARWDTRARCCHRLDKRTSGVLLVRKNRRLNREIAELFETHRIRKCYWALTEGSWPSKVSLIDAPISSQPDGRLQKIDPTGKPAKTSVRIMGKSTCEEVTWLELILKTGRTHQARVHCASVGCRILGDAEYGAKPRPDLFGLHARELRFMHPLTRENVTITADPPAEWNRLLNELRGAEN